MSEDRTKAVAKPAAEAEACKSVKRPARPAKGPVDFDAVYERIAKRFDKVLARLAERE